MPMRHFTEPTRRAIAWTCPSCHAKNTSVLEDGCPSCGAGADARRPGVQPRPHDGPPPSAAPPPQVSDKEPWLVAFETYCLHFPDVVGRVDDENTAAKIFMGGWNAARQTSPVRKPTTLAAAPSEGDDVPRKEKLILATILPHSDSYGPMTNTERDTILAALAFYRDNQLAYGAVEGQLTADQITELIDQLTPEEPEL